MKNLLLIFGIAFALTAHAQTVDKKFVIVNAVHLGLTVADIEVTQHCLANHTCRESNPLMPSCRAGAYAVGMGMVAGEAVSSYYLKRHGSRWWSVGPLIGIGSHTLGVSLTLAR